MTSHCDIAGPAGAPVVVLLHAASYTRKMWLPQIRPLANRYRVLAPDLPGHGTRADEPFTFAAAEDRLQDLLDREGNGRVLLVGASLGGCVAMGYAARFPDVVAGLVLSGSTFDPTTRVCRLVLTGEGVVFPHGAARFTGALHRSVRARFPRAMAEEMIAAGAYWRAAADAVRAMRGVDFRGRLAQYPGPTLILNGRRDWVHRTAERSFARAAQNAAVRTLPEAGHIANLDAPDAFTESVGAFAEAVFSVQTLDADCGAGIEPRAVLKG